MQPGTACIGPSPSRPTWVATALTSWARPLAGGASARRYGLRVEEFFRLWQQRGLVSKAFQEQGLRASGNGRKFSTDANDLLREWAFCLIPGAPGANYLDAEAS